jgi:iron complex transport system substrate-binding protein
MKKIIYYSILLFCFAACKGRNVVPIFPNTNSLDTLQVEFAGGFTIKKDGDITILTVSNPWQGAEDIIYRYILCPKDLDVPDEYAQFAVIRTPIKSVICLSTTHVSFLSALGLTSAIKGLSSAAFVSDSEVVGAIESGHIQDVGHGQGLNVEKIIGLNPDIIFAYSVDGGGGALSRLANLGQTVVFVGEYLEQTTLGKAEWLKFMAEFFDIGQQASERFDAIKDEYISLCNLVSNSILERPNILCGLPWQGIWYIPGGRSWMAQMISDAGGNYLWKENQSHESIPIGIETIVNQSYNADIWINTSSALTLADILAVDERLPIIKPFQTGSIYNNSERINKNGGNDFFESGVVNPHIILKDMIKIFHNHLLPDYELYYYTKLK